MQGRGDKCKKKLSALKPVKETTWNVLARILKYENGFKKRYGDV
jgi:hypothetical protein